MSIKRRTGGNNAALQAAISLAFVLPASGQPMPNARPQGGQVVAGSAAIAAGGTTTTITQSSNRAAIDWRSFDVGRDQSVIFQQPGPSSITLNRVTGPDPSAIAGRISANGQLVLTNPSGVTFSAGAQVNAQSVIVSAPGITTKNFMAGRMVFDQAPNPNARIENAGAITVKEAGLAALVAPSVANSGTITARLGHVVLAGAAAHTLDMYGDGLVSIDITKQVTQAPVGAGGAVVSALVTNTGTIAADGGTVQLTARAADGVVNTLVQAGGRIQANTAGGRAGQIEIAGTGGSVVIEGRVAAEGRAPGTAGGSVVVAGSDATIVAPTARVTASGRTGGGTVAVGTTLSRARSMGPAPAGTSARTVVAAGARLSADATATGDGGRVTVLSTQSTSMAGAVTARGGPTGGNGGMIELSGETGFRLSGTADTSAPHGALGTVVMDPRDLTITDTPTGTNLPPQNADPSIGYAQGGTFSDAYVTTDQLANLTSNIRLQATRDLVVASSFSGGGNGVANNVTLEAGRNLTVASGVTITDFGFQSQTNQSTGVVTLTAASSNIPGYDPAGTLTVLGNINSSGLKLSAGTGGIVLSGALTSQYSESSSVGSTVISTTGSVVQTTGSLVTGSLSGSAASIALVAAGNRIATIDGAAPLTATRGGVSITSGTALTITAGASSPGIVAAAGSTISLLTNDLTLQPGGAGVPALSARSGTVALQPIENGRDIDLTSSTIKPPGALALTTAETGLINAATLQFSGPTSDVTFGQRGDAPVDLVAHGNFSQILLDTGGVVTQNAALVVNSLSNAGSPVILANVTLQNTANSIPAIGNLTVSGGLALSTSGPLSVSGTVTANGGLSLASSGNMTVLGTAYVSGPNGVTLDVDKGGVGGLTIAGTVTSNRATQLTAGTAGISLSGSIVPGQALQIASTGPLVQTTGGIVNGNLTGYASSVSLASRSNTIDGVSGFTATSGDFLLVNSTPLQVFSPGTEGNDVGLTVPTGRTVTLVADSLAINNDSGSSTGSGGGFGISATGGTLVVAPYTANGSVLLTSGAVPTGTLSLTTSELALVDASTLQIGGTGTVPRAGAITIGQPGDAIDGIIDIGIAGFTRLSLNASGAVTQNAALGVTTLAGTAGTLSLANVGNFITELNGFTTTAGDLALHTSSGLTVSNAVTAAGNLTLSTEAVIARRTDNTSLLLAANLSAAAVRFDTTDGNGGATGILQTGGIVIAGTLTGVASALNLVQANQITNLGDFTTSGNLTVGNGRALAVTGAVTSTSGAVTLNAQGISQAPTSSIKAGELDGSSSADTVLDSRLNAVSAMGYFNQTGGSFTLVTSVPELDFGANTGQVSATTGSLTFVADRVGLVAQPAAATSVAASAGSITFTPFTPSRPIALIDTVVSDPNALNLSTSFRSYLHSDTLGLGRAGYAGPISVGGVSTNIDLSAFRALQVQTSGAVTQGTGSVLVLPSKLTVSSLTGTAGSISLPNDNNVGALGLGIGGAGVGLAATSGSLTLSTVANLSLYGPVSASTAVTLTTGAGLTVVGSLTAPVVTLVASGSISEASNSSQITAGTLAITAASAALSSTANQIGALNSAVSGNITLTDAIGLSITAGSTIGGTLNLTVSGALTGGNFTAQALTGSATSVSLTAAGNQLASVGPFTSSAGFSLVDATPLTVAGTVSDATAISLNVGGNLTLAGSLSSPLGAVTLASSGTITQPGGAVSASTLSISATSAALTSTGNRIGTLTSAVSGNLTLTDATGLSIAGGSTIAGTLNLTVGGTLTGGSFTAPTLTGSATSVSLVAPGNRIASLGPFSSTGGFSLADTTPLTVTGPVSDPVAIALNVGGNLALAGSLSSPQGAVTLTSTGTLTQPSGAITAGTLAVTATAATLPGTANQIGTLTSAVSGDLTLTDAIGLGIGAGSTVGGTLNLTVAGALTGGSFTAQSLTGSAASVSLTATGNQLASVGPFTSSGGFSLADATPLTVAGTVSDATVVSLNVGGNLTLAGSLSSPLGAVTLASSGTITQPGGAVSARSLSISATSAALTSAGNRIGTLTSAVPGNLTLTDATGLSIAGGSTIGGTLNLTVAGALTGGNLTAQALTGSATSVSLTATGNRIASVGPFTTTAGFSLADATPLTVAGPVSDPVAIALNVGGNLALAGSLSSPQGAVTLTSTGTLTQPSGAITAGTLAVTATAATLPGTANQIGTLTSAVSGDLVLTDAIGLGIGAGSTIGGTLNLTVGGALTGGSFTAQSLTGSATSVSLTATGNRIAAVGPFASTGGFSLTDSTPLTVAGPVSDPVAIALNVGGNLALPNSLTSPLGAVTLSSSGTIAQTGGAIAARALSISAASAALPSTGNSIGTLRSAISGNVTLTDATGLAIQGGSTVGGTLNLTVAGNLTGGNIIAQTLTGSASSVSLVATGNRIASLGPFASTGGFNLADATSLTIAGAVSDPTAISLNVGGNLALANSLSSPQGAVALTASGTLSQTGGAITTRALSLSAASAALPGAGNTIVTLTSAVPGDLTLSDAIGLGIAAGSTVGGTLNLTVAGALTSGGLTAQTLTGSATSVSLVATGNRIASLGPFASTGGFSLADATSLTVAGPVSDPVAISINSGGNLALAGSLSSPLGAVTLVSSGAITQSGGTITAGTLTGSATSVSLVATGNQIASLGAFTSTGGFNLADATSLTITGRVSDPTSIALNVGGSLTLAGSLSSPVGAVTLVSSGAITQSGGTITAGTLTGSATSMSLTASGNQIASLGPVASTGGFSLVDATSLTIAGPVSDPTSIALNVAGDLALAGALSSPQGAVTLISSGSISQPGGAITAGTLTGSATGSAVLGQAGNSIATLAGFTTGGDFTLVDGRSLVVSAPVDPNTVRLTISGDLSLNSSLTGGTVLLDVTGAITEGPAGVIVTDTLTGRAGSAALNGGNQVATLGAFATTTGFALNDAGPLTLAGPSSDGQSITVVTSGPLTLAGSVGAPAIAFSGGGGIVQPAGSSVAAAGGLSLAANGPVSIGGAVSAGSLTISASGALTQVGGSLSAGTLSGSADSIDLGRAGPTRLDQIAGLAAAGQSPGTLSIVDNAPLRISGTVSGRFVAVTATGSLVLADGAAIRTDGQPSSAQLSNTEAVPGSNLTVRSGADGTATLVQAGTVTIAPLTLPVATLRLDLPATGGAVTLNNLQAGAADLVFNLGRGSATGRLTANNLTVLGASGQVALFGTIRGRSGDAAAETSTLLPAFDPRYTLNGCAISLASCSVVSSVDVPSLVAPGAAIASVIRPDILLLDVLDLSVTRDRDDPTLLLPNISDKDY